jgi:hypothetical protein
MGFLRRTTIACLVTLAFSALVATPLAFAATPFSQNLHLGDRGSSVVALQQFLNAQGFALAQSGAGSPGHETSMFGPHTLRALTKFQSAHGLPATGFFGPLTRAKIAELTTAASSPSLSPASSSTPAPATIPFPGQALPGYAPGQIIFIGGPSPITVTVNTTPPVISAVASTTAASTATITWTTNEAATSEVVYGSTSAYGSATSSLSLVTSHSIGVTGLTSATTYHFAVVSVDAQGNTATSSDHTFTTTDVTPPTVSLTVPSNGSTVSGSSVTLTATASDNVAVAGVKFYINGVLQGSEVTSSPYSIIWNSTATSSGSKTIIAVARDTSNNHATSSAITITDDNTPPVISAISSGTPAAATTTVTWITDEAATSEVVYGLASSYGSATSTGGLATSHSLTLTGLTATTTYHYAIVSADGQGNTATSSDQTFTTAPPTWVLSGASVDMDFADGNYYGGSPSTLLSITRASSATDLLPTSASNYAYHTFSNNQLVITTGSGLLILKAATNQLLNSASPATQTTGTLATGSWTLWVNGSGSATMSSGTATGCGTGTATNGSIVTFTITGAGTCTVTVSGSLNAFQLESGTFGTSFISTAGTTATRAADIITATGPLLTTLQGAAFSAYAKTFGLNVGQPGTVLGYGAAQGLGLSNGQFGSYNARTTDGTTNLIRSVTSGYYTNTGNTVVMISTAGRRLTANAASVITDTVNLSGSNWAQIGANTSGAALNAYLQRLTLFPTVISDGAAVTLATP